MERTFFIIGSYFANLLEKPLSKLLNNIGKSYIFLDEGECIEHYVIRMADCLKNQLLLCKPDCLIIEFQTLLQLFDSVNTQLIDKELADKAFDELIAVIKANFPENRVYIIKTNVPKYYIMAEEFLKPIPKKMKRKKAVRALNQYEKYVQNETKGILINTTSFYFYKKKRGYFLNDRAYEDECYLDIARKISANVKKGKKVADVPNSRCAINRYVKYAGKTIEYKALSIFLDEDNIVDQFILSAPGKFIEEHKKDLLAAKKVKADGFEQWRKKISEIFAENQEFCNIITAFYSIKLGMFQEENISCRELFRNGIVSRDVLGSIQQYVADTGIASPKQITTHNAGYYYALMIGKNAEEALEYAEDNATIEPVLVDIFGSCVARICLRENFSGNKSLSVNKCWFHIPAYIESQKKIEYDKSIYDQLSGLHTQNVYLQFEHKVMEDIRSSQAQWLLVDLYGLTSPCIYSYKGFLYADFERKISKKLGSKLANVLNNTQLLGNWNDILKRMDLWIDTVKEKYGNRIILVRINYSHLTYGDDHVIYAPRDKQKLDVAHSFQSFAFDYVKEKLNCYTIDITNEFCSDDCGFRKRISVHYGYDFYREAYKLIKHIVYNEPEQKKFDNYDYHVRVRRMADMLEHNKAAIVRQFFPQPLDEAVLKLSSEVIRQHEKVIVSWYESSISTEDELLNNWSSEWDISLKRAIVESSTTGAFSDQIIPKDYLEEK